MITYNFTEGKTETKTYKEISNKNQSWMGKDEIVRIFKTDHIKKHNNEQFDTRYEEINY